MGIIDVGAFNQALKLFQFPDDQGVLWTVGATSSAWYRWDGKAWQPGAPAGRLQLPELPMDLTPETERPPLPVSAAWQAPSEPSAPACPKCGTVSTGKKFCTTCGTKLG
jgi:hypothetical protein